MRKVHLDAWLRQERLADQLERMLYDAGLLRDIRPTDATAVSSSRQPPVPVRGQPVLETLIEERRYMAVCFYDSSGKCAVPPASLDETR